MVIVTKRAMATAVRVMVVATKRARTKAARVKIMVTKWARVRGARGMRARAARGMAMATRVVGDKEDDG